MSRLRPEAMFARFCLYGFLKNQRYFEPFIVLALLDRGLSFLAIGTLVAVREVTTNLLEVTSGAVADTWGRRRSMVASMIAYAASFVVLAFAHTLVPLAGAMVLYGIGDAFRSGTHKAMILTWLRLNGRESERTRVYGATRSWSKIGSAVGVTVAASWVFVSANLDALFLLALVPYAVGIANLATYPAELDGERVGSLSVRAIAVHLRESLLEVAHSRPLRRLVAESSAFMGVFESSKDYLQPVLQAAAATWLAGALSGRADGDVRATALLIGPVYVVLSLLGAVASRRAHRLVDRAGGQEAASARIWIAFAAVWATILAATLPVDAGAVGRLLPGVVIVAFVALHALEGVWRPVVLSRFDEWGSEHQGATLLSIESQARSLATMALAPTLGWAIDMAGESGASAWWPLGLVGAAVGVAFAVISRRAPMR